MHDANVVSILNLMLPGLRFERNKELFIIGLYNTQQNIFAK